MSKSGNQHVIWSLH